MVATMEPPTSRTTPLVASGFWDRFEVPDGYRAEIIREELVVTPAPSSGHQVALALLLRQISDAVPDGYLAVPGPGWRLDRDGRVAQDPQPDVVVMRRSDEPLIDPPLLAVEILSPSDLHKMETHDLLRIEGKRLDYAENGLADYLEVDLLGGRRQVRRYELVDGVLELVETVEGDQRLDAGRPFPYGLRPVDLLP